MPSRARWTPCSSPCVARARRWPHDARARHLLTDGHAPLPQAPRVAVPAVRVGGRLGGGGGAQEPVGPEGVAAVRRAVHGQGQGRAAQDRSQDAGRRLREGAGTAPTPLRGSRTSLTVRSLGALRCPVDQALDDSDPEVRDAAAQALGTTCKVCGERAYTAFTESLDKLKQEKVKQVYDEASVSVKTAPARAAPAPAPAASRAAAPAAAAKPAQPSATLQALNRSTGPGGRAPAARPGASSSSSASSSASAASAGAAKVCPPCGAESLCSATLALTQDRVGGAHGPSPCSGRALLGRAPRPRRPRSPPRRPRMPGPLPAR